MEQKRYEVYCEQKNVTSVAKMISVQKIQNDVAGCKDDKTNVNNCVNNAHQSHAHSYNYDKNEQNDD